MSAPTTPRDPGVAESAASAPPSQPPSGTLKGRDVQPGACLPEKKLYTAFLVTGLFILLIGVIVLAAYTAPPGTGAMSSILERINHGLAFVAEKIGTDPLLLIAFPIAIGFGFSVAGGVSLAVLANKNQKAKTTQNSG